MPKDKKIIIFKNTFICKLNSFLKSLFSTQKQIQASENILENRYSQKEEFTKNIKVEENKEMKRLLNLQSMIRNGEIEEKDITKEEKIKLRNLYENQITNLKEKIEKHRQAIIGIKRRK